MEAFINSSKVNPDHPKPSLVQKILFCCRVFGTAFTTFVIHFSLIIISTLRPLIGRKPYRKMCDFLQKTWFDSIFFLMKPTRMHIYGKNKDLHVDDNDLRPRIVVANHTTDVDWLYVWMLAHTCDTPRSGHLKVILKEAIKKIPVFGFILDNFDFIWLKRNWESDRHLIEKIMKKFTTDDQHLWLVLFPEGTIVNTKSQEKCREFAKVEGRPNLDLVLLPRSKGFESLLYATKHLNPEILDVTVGFESYTGEIPTWEMGYERNKDHLIPNVKKLFAGMTGEVFMDVRGFHANDIFDHPLGVQGWLDERWIRKDEILKKFAQNGKFLLDSEAEVKVPQGSIRNLGGLFSANVLFVLIMKMLISFLIRKLKG